MQQQHLLLLLSPTNRGAPASLAAAAAAVAAVAAVAVAVADARVLSLRGDARGPPQSSSGRGPSEQIEAQFDRERKETAEGRLNQH